MAIDKCFHLHYPYSCENVCRECTDWFATVTLLLNLNCAIWLLIPKGIIVSDTFTNDSLIISAISFLQTFLILLYSYSNDLLPFSSCLFISCKFPSPPLILHLPCAKCVQVLRWYYGDITVILRWCCGVILDRNTTALPPHNKGKAYLILQKGIKRISEG